MSESGDQHFSRVDRPASASGGLPNAGVGLHGPHFVQSPSLDGRLRGNLPAMEMKFLLSEAQAREVEDYLRPSLSLDPHADPQSGYSLTTLYVDTPQMDVYHRRGRFRLFKFRVRRYGAAQQIYLERKSKRGMEVRKRRTQVPLEEVALLAGGSSPRGWSGTWFHAQLRRSEFQPVCLLSYDRSAYFGQASEGPIRLTFDRNICGHRTGDWLFPQSRPAQSLLGDQVVCEMKFRGALPDLFKRAVCEFRLTPVGVSKYRHCLDATGAVGSGELKSA